MSKDNEATRREAIKSTGAITLGLLGGGSIVTKSGVTPVKAADEPASEWSKNAKSEDNANADIGVYLGSTVGWYGADWDSTYGVWRHKFRLNSTISSRYASDGSDLNAIRQQEMSVTLGTCNGMADIKGPEYTGVYPKLTDNPEDYDHYELAYEIAKEAIASLSQYAAFAFKAADIASKYVVETGDESGNHIISHYWDHYGNTGGVYGDVSHYKWFEPFTSGEADYFDVYSDAYGTFDNNCGVNFTFKIDGSYSPTEGKVGNLSTSDTTTTSAGTSLFETEQGWIVEKIPQAKIPERAPELGLTPERVSELRARNEPAYFAHRANIEVEASER